MDHCLRWRLKMKAIRYDLFQIHLTFISFTGTYDLIYNWPAPNISGFIAQLVRASYSYREVTAWTREFYFSGFLRNCINCVHNSSFDIISAVLIWFISYTSHFHLSVNAFKILNPVMKNRASLFPNFFWGERTSLQRLRKYSPLNVERKYCDFLSLKILIRQTNFSLWCWSYYPGADQAKVKFSWKKLTITNPSRKWMEINLTTIE